MIFIDLENNGPSDNWRNRAKTVTQRLIAEPDHDARCKIIDDNEKLWSELKESLSKMRNRKCWYSESINDGAHCHVDHFRPKKKALTEDGVDQGGYWWLAFDWMNYRFSGPATNVRKKDYFPVLLNKAKKVGDNLNIEDTVLLDPIVMGDADKFAFEGIEGKVLPKSVDEQSRDYKRAAYSIYRYNLNSEGLKEGRRQKHAKIANLINQSQELLAFQSINYDLARKYEIIRIWKELRDLAHPDSEYSATVKYCLKSCGYDWALNITTAA